MRRLLNLSLLLLPVLLPAAEYRLEAVPTEGETVVIDGKLLENCWKKGAESPAFSRVVSAGDLKYGTKVRIAYGPDAVYVAAVAEIEPGFIPQRQDSPWNGERIEFVLKPDPEETAYFLFSVSADGIMRKEGWFGSPDWSNPESFKCKWESAVAVSETHWTMEVKIPYDSMMLESRPGKGTLWKCNFCRGNGDKSVVYSALNPKFSGFHYSGCELIFQ